MTATARQPADPASSPSAAGSGAGRRFARLGSSTARRTPFVAVVVTMLALGLVGQLLLNTSLQRGSFRLHEMQSDSAGLAETVQVLEQELAARESPAELAARARLLGMVPGGAPVFLTLANGSVRGTPTPAPAPTLTAAAPTLTAAAPIVDAAPTPIPAPAPAPAPAAPTPAVGTVSPSAPATPAPTASGAST